MKRKARRTKTRFERRDLKLDDLKEIVTRAKGVLSEADYTALTAAVETLAFLTLELQAKGASIDRLRKLVFGASTEKTSQVLDDKPVAGGDGAGGDGGAADGGGGGGAPAANTGARPKAPGHGRNGAGAYRGATKVKVPHTKLQCGAGCPECQKGKIYPLSEPAVLVRVTGMAPLGATVYECERMRCNLCGEVFTADAPAGVGNQKYDETAASMIGLLKYGAGLSFNRIEKLERGLGIPLPAATQWEVVEHAAGSLGPAHEGLIQEAAQGEVLYNDDTTAKILELMAESQQEAAAGEDPDERTGVFTTGIVSTRGGHRIALFFTGRQHAGENLTDVLARRAAGTDSDVRRPVAQSARRAPDGPRQLHRPRETALLRRGE
jgi:transposase